MQGFSISSEPIENLDLKSKVLHPQAGGFVLFEGWVRNHNEGKEVLRLEYEAYEGLAKKEADRIMNEAKEKFDIVDALVCHRVGMVEIGEIAVWVGVSAVHRGTAFDACEYIIDELKIRVPVWKNEHYVDGSSGWIECHECSKHAHKKHDDCKDHHSH